MLPEPCIECPRDLSRRPILPVNARQDRFAQELIVRRLILLKHARLLASPGRVIPLRAVSKVMIEKIKHRIKLPLADAFLERLELCLERVCQRQDTLFDEIGRDSLRIERDGLLEIAVRETPLHGLERVMLAEQSPIILFDARHHLEHETVVEQRPVREDGRCCLVRRDIPERLQSGMQALGRALEPAPMA